MVILGFASVGWYVGLDFVEEQRVRCGRVLGKSLLLLSNCQGACRDVGRDNKSLNLRISQEKEIMARCAVSGFSPWTPFVTPVLPGPGRDIRMKMGWKVLSKTRKSGVWFFRDAGGWVG